MQCPTCQTQNSSGAICRQCGTDLKTQLIFSTPMQSSSVPPPPPPSSLDLMSAYIPYSANPYENRSPKPPKWRRLFVIVGIVMLLLVIILSVVGSYWYHEKVAYPSYLLGTGTLALADSLSQQDQWRSSVNASGGLCQFTKGAYHISSPGKTVFTECSSIRTFSSFAFEVHMTIMEGDCGGITFRESGTWQFYYFQICQYGSYTVSKYINSNNVIANKKLQDATHSGSISTGNGQQNKIAIIADGDTMTFYVNEQEVGQQRDSSYISGNIGLAASPGQNRTDVAYTNARVWGL